MNNFELAAIKKYRFPHKGLISTEDLYDLSLTELDAIYKNLNREKIASSEDSLLTTKKENTDLLAKIEIVKQVVSYKQELSESARLARERKEKKNLILATLHDKQKEGIKNMNEEDLQKLLEELG